jgi:hypothetical protein
MSDQIHRRGVRPWRSLAYTCLVNVRRPGISFDKSMSWPEVAQAECGSPLFGAAIALSRGVRGNPSRLMHSTDNWSRHGRSLV